MRSPRLEPVGWLLVALVLAHGAARDWATWRQLTAARPAAERRSQPLQLAAADTIPDVVEDIGSHNVFRADRSASADTATGAAPPAIVAQPAQPLLSLRGIVGGPPWSAIVDGVPGHQMSVVLRLADTVQGLRVSMIRRDTVVIRARDTTWKLSFPPR